MGQILTDYTEKFDAITDELLTLAGTKKKVFIYPHIGADGDALGSSLGLALLLTQIGVEARILGSEPVSDKLAFLPHERYYDVFDGSQEQFEAIRSKQGIGLAIDNSGGDRLAWRERIYLEAPTHIVIDHHISDLDDLPLMLVNTQAAAVCEIITFYAIYLENRFDRSFLTYQIALALMTGMVTDTGRFSFSSTTAKTFEAASYLMTIPLPMGELTEHLFDTISETKLRLMGITANEAEFYHEKQMLIAELSRETLGRMSWVDTDLEGLPSLMRNVDGVEVAILLRELGNGDIRGNIRSGANFDAQAFARRFGGGGHIRAAGFTVKGSTLTETKARIIELAGEVLSIINQSAES